MHQVINLSGCPVADAHVRLNNKISKRIAPIRNDNEVKRV